MVCLDVRCVLVKVLFLSRLGAAHTMKVTNLHRFVVKGLGADSLESFELKDSHFPSDRRFGLLKSTRKWKGEWLHKENFMCAFTKPEFLGRFKTSFSDNNDILTLNDPSEDYGDVTTFPMATEAGRDQLAEYMSDRSGEKVVCVTSDSGDFQFGNTSSGVKHGDDKARSIHMVFQATVDALQEKVGVPLNTSRFRPNIVVQSDAPAFSEFEWIGRTISCGELELKIVNKTVRCQAVNYDPFDRETVLDIPALLMKHFPEHGPYLGVYCVVNSPGTITIGQEMKLLP